jgi:hypothetical protein
MPIEYRTVFEISQKGFTWWFALVGLLPAIPGAVIWHKRKTHRLPGRAIWVSYVLPGFAVLWVCLVSVPEGISYLKLQKAYRMGRYSTVEGTVADFRPMPSAGHSAECFRVKTQEFCYGDNIISPGFNNDIVHGGPIRAGLPVRIAYVGDDILRLDVDAHFYQKPF